MGHADAARGVVFGRESELARLGALPDAARAGESSTLLISGSAGIGKTSLLRAAFHDLTGFVSRLGDHRRSQPARDSMVRGRSGAKLLRLTRRLVPTSGTHSAL